MLLLAKAPTRLAPASKRKSFLVLYETSAPAVISPELFTGIFLKGTEGVASMMSKMIKSAFKRNLWSKLGYLHVRKGMKEMSETMDYKSTGGAMLLGVNGVVVKAHGNSDAYSFKCAMNIVKKMAEANIVNKIKEGLEK